MLLLGSSLALILGFQSPPTPAGQDMKAWFTAPATRWTQALPVGNGDLGAMVFGGTAHERLALNESSLWSGGPQDADEPKALEHLARIRQALFEGHYREAEELAQRYLVCRGAGSGYGDGFDDPFGSYQMLGNLWLDLELGADPRFSNYRRELDLARGLAITRFEVEGRSFTRTVFASHPDAVLVVRIECAPVASDSTQSGSEDVSRLALSLSLDRDPRDGSQGGEDSDAVRAGREDASREAIVAQHDDEYALALRGTPVGYGTQRFFAGMQVLRDPQAALAAVEAAERGIRITASRSLTLVLAATTSLRASDPEASVKATLAAARARSYDELLARHVADHASLFERVRIDLGPEPKLPTNERIERVRGGELDPALLGLYAQYGRYLLIASSRPGGWPANLQGIWCDHIRAPWNCDWHANINVQMNYWPADSLNLTECFEPYLAFMERLVAPGTKTARTYYGTRGWTLHTVTNPFGYTSPGEAPSWGLFPMAGPWLVAQAIDHFEFQPNAELGRRIARLASGSAAFVTDYLVQDPVSKQLVAGPANSPENAFQTADGQIGSLCMGAAMNQQIAGDLLRRTLRIRDFGIEPKQVAEIEAALADLADPGIAPDGRLREWNADFAEVEPGHRHMSHLYALHPGDAITPDATPERFVAASRSLAARLAAGGGHTGWSRAWIINFQARLLDGEAALDQFQALLAHSTLPNLFDTHPPFQIDGNFGAAAGLAEMLVQSHEVVAGRRVVRLLPAWSKRIPSGSVHGLRAREGLEVSLDWADGQLARATLRATGGPVAITLACAKARRDVDLAAGSTLIVGPDLETEKP